MFHLMTVHGADAPEISFETDRMRFIGRGGSVAAPIAMTDRGALSNTEGSVLDPIAAIRHRMTIDAGATVDDRHGVGRRRNAGCRAASRRQIPGSPSRGSRVRTDVDAQPGRAAAAQRHRSRFATLCAPRELGDLCQRIAARGRECSGQEPSRAIRPLGLCNLRRPADRVAADRRCRQYRTGAPTRAGACLLAPQGAGRGSGDLERRSRRLSAAAPGTNHRPDRRRCRSPFRRSTRGHFRSACGADIVRGPRSFPIGRPRDHHRQPRNAGRADQPSRTAERRAFRDLRRPAPIVPKLPAAAELRRATI